MDPEEIQQLLKTGIEAAQSGNKIIARHILEQVVSKDPANEMGWLWLASVVDTVEQRREALQEVLSINPNNERARQAISKLPRPEGAAAAAAEPDRAPSAGGRLSRAPVSSTVRTTPPPQPAQPIFVPKPAKRRKQSMSPVTFVGIGIMAIAMIALGVIMLVVEDPLSNKETPTPSVAPVVVVPTRTPFITPGPSPTPRPVDTVGPTWTPSVTPLPTDTPIPTATTLPLSTYKLLASAKRDGQDSWGLYSMLASGADESRVILSLAALSGDLTLLDVFDAAYSLDGAWIAFTARLSQGGSEFEDLFVAPANGGDMRRITTLNAGHVEGATWSPDGQQIAFASDADGDFDIYRVSVDGGTPRLMTRNTAEDRDPAWSPDGRWIAYGSDLNGPGTLEVWRMSSSGGNAKQLTNDMNSSFSPAWSPDSQSIVFVSDRRTNDDLYIMNAEGQGQRAILVRDVAANELDPAWSPDGDWIAFSSNRAGFVYDLYLIRPDGTELQRVTRRDDDTRYVDWLP